MIHIDQLCTLGNAALKITVHVKYATANETRKSHWCAVRPVGSKTPDLVRSDRDVWLSGLSGFEVAKEFPKGLYLRKNSCLWVSLELVVLVLREEGRPLKEVDRPVNNGGWWSRMDGELKPLLIIRLLCSTACFPEGRVMSSSRTSLLLRFPSGVVYTAQKEKQRSKSHVSTSCKHRIFDTFHALGASSETISTTTLEGTTGYVSLPRCDSAVWWPRGAFPTTVFARAQWRAATSRLVSYILYYSYNPSRAHNM